MTDNVNQPAHYILANGHQVIEVSENLTSNGGQAVQYIARATRTDGVVKGDPVEDLRKAVWFIEREIERLAPAEESKSWTLSDLSKLRKQVWGWNGREPVWEVVVGDWLSKPREWDLLDNVPPGVIVEDKDGDYYRRIQGTAKFEISVRESTHGQHYEWQNVWPFLYRDQELYGPYKEVIDG